MVADTEEATEFVVTVKVTLLLPAAILTEPGTAAEVLLLERETVAPPAGAAPLRVTVPVTDVPPVTLAGLTATGERNASGGSDSEQRRFAAAAIVRRNGSRSG